MNKGRDGVAFGIWTEHPAFDYDNRSEENALPFGAGVCCTMIDEKGNERMLFGIVFLTHTTIPSRLSATAGWRDGP